jgi:hypothetical protein
MRAILPARTLRLFAAALLVAGASACDRSPTDGDHADAAAVRLTVGAQVLTVTAAGAQTGTLTLAQGAHAVAVTWLDASLNAITDLDSDLSLQILAAAGTSGVTFAPNGLYAGTLTASSAGQKTMSVRLMHGNHADFAQSVTFTVQ